MQLSLTGAVQDLLTLGGMDLQPHFSGKELAEIGPVFDTELPGLGPFNIGCRLSGSAEAIALDEFSAIVDKSDFSGRVVISPGEIPDVDATLKSKTVLLGKYLADRRLPDTRHDPDGFRPGRCRRAGVCRGGRLCEPHRVLQTRSARVVKSRRCG